MELEIVGGEVLGELAQLQGLAEAIFGRGRRQPHWFRRKLVREGVEPHLCALAREVGRAGPDGALLGYALLGRAASLGPVARGAGVGVVEAARGRGLARALIDFAAQRAAAAGCEAVEFLAEPARLGWYLDQGFELAEEQLALLAPGLGGAAPIVAGRIEGDEGDPHPGGRALWSWFPEAWSRTPAEERAQIELETPGGARARAWLSREGRAWLVHRLELAEECSPAAGLVHELALALRRRAPSTTPLLLYPVAGPAPGARRERPPGDRGVAPHRDPRFVVTALARGGFEVAQRSFVVRRATPLTA